MNLHEGTKLKDEIVEILGKLYLQRESQNIGAAQLRPDGRWVVTRDHKLLGMVSSKAEARELLARSSRRK